MKKIGISCGGLVRTYGLDRALEICKESGFDAIDVDLNSRNLKDAVYGGSDDAFESYFTHFKEKAKDLELEISQSHGRCGTYVPDNYEDNETVRRLVEKDMRATAILGAPACVQHFMNTTRWGKQPAEVMRNAGLNMYRDFIPYAEKYNVKIAIETFGAARIQGARIRDFFADPNEFKYQFDKMDTEYKTMCVDTGHTHEAESFWVPSPEEYIRILGSDVTLLHLHDNNGHYDDHLLPGMGNINWQKVFDSLDDIGYKGVYNFELSLKFGKLNEQFVNFAGRYLRRFVDERGVL